jgi:hypothetical protein
MKLFRSFGCLLVACSLSAVDASAAESARLGKASDWLGSLVLAPNGEEIGTIRDFAIDPASGKMVYIVVSVGSFLIEDNLIAVRPDALSPSGDHQWVLYTDVDTLRRAQRFATDKAWPAHADVARTVKGPAEPPRIAQSSTDSEKPADRSSDIGTATISTGTKTAYLSGGERYIKDVAPAPTAPPKAVVGSSPPPIIARSDGSEPKTKFDRLDKDRDGVLNRSEIALQMGPKDKYSQVDANANGVIERDEFETLEAQHQQGD